MKSPAQVWRATAVGLAVFGGALALGACFWLLGPMVFEVVVDVRTPKAELGTLVRDLEQRPSVTGVFVEPTPRASAEQCGYDGSRVRIESRMSFMKFPGHFDEVLLSAVSLGICGNSFVFGGDGLRSARLLAYGSLPAAVIIVFVLAVACRRQQWWRRIAGWAPRMSWHASFLAAIGGAAAMVFGQFVLSGVAGALGAAPSSREIDSSVAPLLVTLLPLTVVAAPIVEEYAFRGLILERYLGQMPASAAIMLSALVFALAHWPQSVVAFASFVVIGLVLGAVWWATRSLIAVVTAHAIHNAALSLLAVSDFW